MLSREEFVERLSQVAARMAPFCDEPALVQCEAPASAEQIEAVEREIGCSMPIDLQKFFGTISRRCHYLWGLDDTVAHKLGQPLAGHGVGSLRLRLEDVPIAFRNWSSWTEEHPEGLRSPTCVYRFSNLFPLQEDVNGDTLAIVTGGPNEGAIITCAFYESDIDSGRLARNLWEFLEVWGQLGFVGPEGSAFRPFYDRERDALRVDTPMAQQWRRAIGLE